MITNQIPKPELHIAIYAASDTAPRHEAFTVLSAEGAVVEHRGRNVLRVPFRTIIALEHSIAPAQLAVQRNSIREKCVGDVVPSTIT